LEKKKKRTNSTWFFVLGQKGTIWLFGENNTLISTFMNVQAGVHFQGEMGLLGLFFICVVNVCLCI